MPKSKVEVQAIQLARSIWLININELNPTGRAIYPELLPRLREVYGFVGAPDRVTEESEKNGLKFTGGVFKNHRGERIAIDFTIFNDGLVASSRSNTRDTDEFLGDAMRKAADEFGLNDDVKAFRSCTHASEILFRMPYSLDSLNPGLEALAEHLRVLAGKDGIRSSWEASVVAMVPDPVHSSNWKNQQFRIERRVDAGFDEFRYYSFAPVTTDGHIELIQEFVALCERYNTRAKRKTR